MLSDDVREKKRGLACCRFYCLGFPTLIEVRVLFALANFQISVKSWSSFARRVAEEEKDDDDDEFKEEIRTTR